MRYTVEPGKQNRRHKTTQDPQSFWVYEQNGDPLKHHDRRVSKETVYALKSLLKDAKDNQINGLALVALRNDGNHEIIVTGRAYESPFNAVGLVSRLEAALRRLPGYLSLYFD